MERAFLEMARRLLPLPTAPYCEHFVAGAVLSLGQALPGVTCRADRHGNLLLLYEGCGSGRRFVRS